MTPKHAKQVGAIGEHGRLIRCDRERPVEPCERFFSAAEQEKDITVIIEDRYIFGFDIEHLETALEGFFVAAEKLQRCAAVAQRDSIVRLKLERPVKGGERFIVAIEL